MQSEIPEFWIDLNLPPILAVWLGNEFNVVAKSFAELGFITTSDVEVFKIARTKSNTIIITTKDYDFITLPKI